MTRVLIDPVELRRCGARIKDGATELEMASSGLTCVSLPEMPAAMVGEVSSAIQSVRSSIAGELSGIREAAVELTRRALWAEIADKLASGTDLSDSQLREFNAWLMDGSMLRYANSYQAGLAGDFVGAAYRDTFRNPEDLIELAQILRGSQQNSAGEALEAFSASFVESFGADNMSAVPRVIQAMEWSHVINNSFSIQDQRVLTDVARAFEGKELEQDPVEDLLAPFSLALANATYSGRLSRTTEEAIARDDDTWATAQLLHTGRFGTRFLLDCFDKGVVEKISEDSRYRMAGLEPPPGDAYTLGRFWEDGDHEGLSYDTKALVLDALARNPDAARAALTTDLSGVKAWDIFGQEHDVTNPIRLLFDYGEFDDDGSAFGRAYEAAGDALRADPGDDAAIDRANRLTLDVVDRVLNGENSLDGVTDSLARDLADHHVDALHISALANQPSDADGGGAGFLDPAKDHRIHLSRQEVVDLLSEITSREEAGRELLESASRYQADTILAGTKDAPAMSGDYTWAASAGAFNDLLMEAGDVNRLDDFKDAEAQQKMVVGFINDVASLVRVHPAVGIGIDHAIDAATSGLGPSEEELVRDNNRAHALIENGLAASIVQGYAENGHIDLSRAEYLDLVEDGRLIGYNSLEGIPRARFEEWMASDPEVNRIVHEALQEASR